MKISIGYIPRTGAWGGGNAFLLGLSHNLVKSGHTVINHLDDSDIDIILIVEPRRLQTTSFSPSQAWRYVRFVNRKAIIVHRINECDERKNTNTINNRLKRCNEVADYTVFVGSWLRELDLWCSSKNFGNETILNGSDPSVFNDSGFLPWNGKEKMKLITHHWGGNWLKGFDVYNAIDKLLDNEFWQNKISFSYMGNLPKGFEFKNATHIKPKSGKDIAVELKKHHAYITGSVCEPGGNHQNEAVQCGLPILYLNSGCMPEYLHGVGLEYASATEIEKTILELLSNYPKWQLKTKSYKNTLNKSSSQYERLFIRLLESRDLIKRYRNKKFSFYKDWWLRFKL